MWLQFGKIKKNVKMLSNIHVANKTSTVQRRMEDGSVTNFSCPLAVTEYNKYMYMGGVDKSDQLRGYYHVRPEILQEL